LLEIVNLNEQAIQRNSDKFIKENNLVEGYIFEILHREYINVNDEIEIKFIETSSNKIDNLKDTIINHKPNSKTLTSENKNIINQQQSHYYDSIQKKNEPIFIQQNQLTNFQQQPAQILNFLMVTDTENGQVSYLTLN
jgi:hypothetical protein